MQKRTKIGHFLKQYAIIEPNIKERLDRYQEINNMTGFTVGGKLVETPGLTTEQIAQIEKEQKNVHSSARIRLRNRHVTSL